ncbi:MAG TPA: DUF6438 domain-containing protein [Planctomycetota bacterium]|nr:DUF6438 domain-containing protein [Planctomycetota bacterium]
MRFLGGCLVLLLASCSSKSDAPQPRYPRLGIADDSDLADVEITLEHTPCRGSCPAYTLTLHGDGNGIYVGRGFVKREGRHELEIESNLVRDVLDRFERIDFFAMEHDAVDWIVEDGSAMILTLKSGTRTRSFRNEWSGTESELQPDDARFHTELTAISDFIESIVDAEHWIGTESEREALK